MRLYRLERRPLVVPVLSPAPQPVPVVTWTLAGSIIAVFLVQCAAYWEYHDDVVGEALAFSPQAMEQGRYWTLLAYAWAHAVDMFGTPWLFWAHVGVNVLSLLWFGPAVEEMLGRWRYIGLYLGGTVAAGARVDVAESAALGRPGDHRGERRGLCGDRRARHARPARLGTGRLSLRFAAGPQDPARRFHHLRHRDSAVIFHWMPDVAHWAHLGGAVFGFLYVLVVGRRPPLSS